MTAHVYRCPRCRTHLVSFKRKAKTRETTCFALPVATTVRAVYVRKASEREQSSLCAI
jgi:hypothetical protein